VVSDNNKNNNNNNNKLLAHFDTALEKIPKSTLKYATE
jgi:hypothetical protein